ncbi:hypothetical protein RhiirA4_546789 [Rhizophagus irregularis]|uniref:Uncharacterized protein n=1 Tax=Rhizophagus irregularis TaxID=588596 RepID=A0A2I1GZ69_9GLOM|nr:hypothetical protein RhiirA4_546789 [Rhizophagus irregularis]
MNITYVIVWNFTIPILQNLVQFFFIYKAIKPKTKHSNTSMTSRFALANAARKDDKRRMDGFSRDDEGGTLTTTFILTNQQIPIILISVGMNTILMKNFRHQKSFESSIGLIAEENSDGSHRQKEIIVVRVPIAAVAAKASWNKPDINDHLSADERKRLSDSM